MPRTTPTDATSTTTPPKGHKRNTSATAVPRQRGASPALSMRLGTCCGLNLDHVTGIPRPCSAPPVKAHGLCSAHAEHFEIQQLWRAILRPDWKKTVDTFAASAVSEKLGKHQPRLPKPSHERPVEPAWPTAAPLAPPAPVVPPKVSAALARFRAG